MGSLDTSNHTESLLFLGASGQVGGAFLTIFRKAHPTIPITAYLRSTTLDAALTALGNTTVIHGTFEEFDKVENLASTHSIIINCAASFNPPLTEAILKGIRATKITSHRKPILLHLSGTGNFVDHSTTGSYVPPKNLFNDANPDQVRKIDASYPPNGATDELILKAAAAGDVNAFFVCPGGIYGNSSNHLGRSVGDKSAEAAGVWVLWNTENVAGLGFSPFVGEGTSIIRLVHVDDVVALMMLVLKKAVEVWDEYMPEDVFKNFYVAVEEEPYKAKPVAEAYADLLWRRGNIAKAVVRSVKFEEAGKVAGYIAGNTQVKNDNAKSLGWKARDGGFFETLKVSK
ncbi:hypothetical protein P7C71_g5361, partial [Lecanoromycetidae sp. Uapishka_2]